MSVYSIFLCGVGGQGIGLLGDILCYCLCEVGIDFTGCETHGVAQRGGCVESHIRIGKGVLTPTIGPHEANVVIAMERLEALRAARQMLAGDGTLLYSDEVIQPLHTRAQGVTGPTVADVQEAVSAKNGTCIRVPVASANVVRMQNVALLARFAALSTLPGVDIPRVRAVLEKRIPFHLKQANLDVFDAVLRPPQ